MTRNLNDKDNKPEGIINKAIKTVSNVIEGFTNHIDNVKPEFYESRKATCLSCPELKNYENTVEGSIHKYQCTKCGCFMEAKWTIAGAGCPLNKWNDSNPPANTFPPKANYTIQPSSPDGKSK